MWDWRKGNILLLFAQCREDRTSSLPTISDRHLPNIVSFSSVAWYKPIDVMIGVISCRMGSSSAPPISGVLFDCHSGFRDTKSGGPPAYPRGLDAFNIKGLPKVPPT